MNRAEYAALAERRACEDGMCWAEPLIEACDHWKAETERLRDLLTEAHRQDFGTPGWRERVRRALKVASDEEDR